MALSLPVCNESALLSSPPVFDNILLPVTVDKSEDVFEAHVSNSSAESGRIFRISDFVKTRYSAGALNNDMPAQTARLTNLAHV